MYNVKLISFDFDGTICPDSNNYLQFEERFIKILKEKYSLKDISREKRQEIKDSLTPIEWENLKKEARKLWIENFKIPHEVKDSLNKLKDNFKLIIFSVASKNYINKIILNNGINASIFDKIYSTRDDFDGKVSKEVWMFKEIAKKEGLVVSECAHIGDHEYQDYLSAKEAGFASFLVDNSHLNRIKISELGEILKNNKT
ncbi:MAG: HAD family hydrolase [Candidatus Pacearchaeota archaeon]|nr:HAD family hydrolase [Candidatus Pacearchaeota archaeon]